MTAADSGSKTAKKTNQKQWNWSHSTAAAGCITLNYFLTMLS